VMVCMDGFILTHAYERVDLPTQQQVDAFLPGYEPHQVLNPADPVSIGAMVGPEAFTEVRYLAHDKQMRALELIPEVAAEFTEAFSRSSGGLIRPYRIEDADTIVVALGSVLGTIEDTVESCAAGTKIGVHGYTVIAGLGGRAITKASLRNLFADALDPLTFLGPNRPLIERELARTRAHRRSGSSAENILRDIRHRSGVHQLSPVRSQKCLDSRPSSARPAVS
jgi:pyruvate ferredoxin oxidoreductase alpha subunit